jgi:hypothetical protein
MNSKFVRWVGSGLGSPSGKSFSCSNPKQGVGNPLVIGLHKDTNSLSSHPSDSRRPPSLVSTSISSGRVPYLLKSRKPYHCLSCSGGLAYDGPSVAGPSKVGRKSMLKIAQERVHH